jgi:glycosyltransferase involved in cell wall biosynthesis
LSVDPRKRKDELVYIDSMRFFSRRRPPDLSALAASASVRTSGAVRPSWDVDLLVWIGGDPERAAEALAGTLEGIREQLPEAFVTFLVDGPEWERTLRVWAPRFPDRREVRLPRATDLPQLLYALGVEGSAHPWTAFLWPGCGVSGEGVRGLREAARGGGDLVYGDLAGPAPEGLFHPMQHGWLQMADLVPMHNCLLARGSRVRFDPSPLLRGAFWWDFTLRLSRQGRLVHTSVAAAPVAWDWGTFPFRSTEAGDLDLASRYVAREGIGSEEGFRRDLPALKVTLLSGLHDAHQNQLFFYNFFSRVAGEGALTWRTVLYERCRPEDLDGCGLAVFSRPRFPEVPALLDRCHAAGIPSLVMIDDNWIAAGEEFARFERLFTPGRPAFEVFLDSLRRADAVLVFNPVLEAEVRPWARRVLRLPPNVDLSLFAAPVSTQGPPREPGLLVGFAGSPRFEGSGFRGLARFLARRADARLLVMAHEVPEELRGVPPERLTFVPWRHDYAAYARDLAALRPDVLIAPLDASRFSASKIPIKLLESAAAGAAGIYSAVPPYTGHVRHGETGLLVENREEAWAEALDLLYTDSELRRRIAGRALSEVRERFATERVLPAFLALLRTVAGREETG